MKKVVIYVEPTFHHQAIQLLEVARQLFPHGTYETYALAINGEREPLKGLFDFILYLDNPHLQQFNQHGISEVIHHVHCEYHFDAILFLATHMGRAIAPAVAMRLDTGIVADVTKIRNTAEGIELIRPAYSGKIMAGIRITGEGPVMMSIRSGVFSYVLTQKKLSRIIELKNLPYTPSSIKVIKRSEKIIPYDITKSKVLISGGKGIAPSMKELTNLATLLHGEVSASRAIVDKGIVSRAIQVGQSGKTVSPSLYIALGIHGAIQHIEGLKDVDFIISVNTNKDATICSISDIVVEGDALTFINRLVEKIERGKNT